MANEVSKKVQNPMEPAQIAGNSGAITHSDSGMMAVASQGEIARVQAQLIAAKNFRRDTIDAADRILSAFQRESLCKVAMYEYQRGGTEINDLSIRAAEEMARQWGNIDFGFRELEQKRGESTVEAYCWDLETNTRRAIAFTVPHLRATKGGNYRLEDPRDIYEMVANQASRRVRACILAIIPRDVQDAAKEQIGETLKQKFKVTPDAIKTWVEAFAKMGVTREQIEKRIQRRIDAMTPANMISLQNIYNSIRDGMSSASDWFETTVAETDAKTKTGNEKAAAALGVKTTEPTERLI